MVDQREATRAPAVATERALAPYDAGVGATSGPAVGVTTHQILPTSWPVVSPGPAWSMR